MLMLPVVQRNFDQILHGLCTHCSEASLGPSRPRSGASLAGTGEPMNETARDHTVA